MGLFDFFRRNRKRAAEPVPKVAQQTKVESQAKEERKPAAPAGPLQGTPLDGRALKQRLIEWNVQWSDEKLTPYFDEALLSVRESDDPSVLFWGCSTLHELLRIPSNGFRDRIGEIAAVEKARDQVVLMHLNSIRYLEPDPDLDEIIKGNLLALTGRSMEKEQEDARQFNAAWIEFAGKVGKYTGSMTPSERKAFEQKIYGICGRLDCCSAVGRVMEVTVQLMQAVNRAQQMGGVTFVTTVDLTTGEKETSRTPNLQDAENFGFHMIAALPKDVLQQCLDGRDFSTAPDSREGNYNLMLNRGAAIAGLR